MSTAAIKAMDQVRIVKDPYEKVTVTSPDEAYLVVSVSELEGLPALYEVQVPNHFDSDTFPYYEDEIELWLSWVE